MDEAGDQLEKDIQYVDTKLGKIQIQVIGKISTHANILSIHDIGISSAQCFDRFTEYVQGESPYSKFCMVYLTLPGQYKGASGLNKEVGCKMYFVIYLNGIGVDDSGAYGGRDSSSL